SVEQGLQRDEAVRALTVRAAEILGVEDQLGTIETGKIANLTIVRGDLFAKDRRITHVFIDGRPVDLKPALPAGTPPTRTASLASGTWTLRVQLEGQPERSVTLNLQQQVERLSGSIQGDFGSAQIANASVGASGDIKFTVPITTGAQTTEATFNGTINANEMRGTVTTVGTGAGTFNGTRGGGATP
ncbi:MAG TPA: amidohydrolase family protein, partial [Pyrinomonadaceae bacterium]|nr:amidohydrolase family protein [Pyrinomonadaceae bacterium]